MIVRSVRRSTWRRLSVPDVQTRRLANLPPSALEDLPPLRRKEKRRDRILAELERGQEVGALSRGGIDDQLMTELSKRRMRFVVPKLPSDSPSAAYGHEDVDPHELLAKLTEQPTQPPFEAPVVESLVRAMSDVLRPLTSPVLDIEMPTVGEDPRFIVIGDTHGQLPDVLHIFADQGPPSPSVVYLLNGDIVDRGHFAVEIWLLVIAFKLRYPDSVHVLRGNHENDQMITRPFKMGGGFAEECLTKYGRETLVAFQELFRLLPLFAVVQKDVFVVHGGLFRTRNVSLERLRAMAPCEWQRSFPNPPTEKELAKGKRWSEEEEILFDAQWADPHYGSGSKKSSRGKVAATFGEDVTKAFLDDAKLSLCIRSHRVPKSGKGYEFVHEGRLMTVFSASRYGGVLRNRGAVVVLRKAMNPEVNRISHGEEQGTPTLRGIRLSVVEHDLVPGVNTLKKNADAASAASGVRSALDRQAREYEGDTTQYALGLLCADREILWQKSRMRDKDGSGRLQRSDICEVLAETCGELGWDALLRRAAPDLGNDDVLYGEFLSGPRVRWRHDGAGQVTTLATAALTSELTLSGLVSLFDSLGDGLVSPREAREAVRRLMPSLRDKERARLVNELFGNKPKELSAALYRLALWAEQPVLTEDWMRGALQQLRAYIERTHGEPFHVGFLRWFQAINGPKRDELVAGDRLVRVWRDTGCLEVAVGRDKLSHLVSLIDQNGSGRVSYLELLRALDETQPKPLPRALGLEGTLPALLFAHKAAVLQACHSLDPLDTGRVSAHNFLELCDALGSVAERPVKPATRAAFQEELGGRDLSYVEALGSFEVYTETGPWIGSHR